MTERATRLGRVKGVERLGVDTFLGLRFAEPPRRFRPCVPAGGWVGTFDATRPGPRAMQSREGFASRTVFGPPAPGELSEDCLFLNVHVPAGATGPLPVLFWIHGGGFGGGSANQYDGTALARTAHAVVVTVNYRLGLFGLADLRVLGEGFGRAVNVWLGDLLTALRWVGDNIADYGGDPGNVTVLGESAGATSTLALAACPEAAGLLRRGVACSPAFVRADPPDHLAAVAALRGLPVDEVPGYLLVAPAEELVALSGILVPQPFVDGDVIARSPHDGIAVPLVTGCAPHEGALIDAMLRLDGVPDDVVDVIAEAVAPLVARGDAAAPGYLARLRELHPVRDGYDLSALVWGDLFRRSSVDAATAASAAGAWHYLFDVPCVVDGVALPSTHCVDLPFTFNWFDDPEHRMGDWVAYDDANRALARRWVAMLARFARTGDPSGPLGDWPRYRPGDRRTLVVSTGDPLVAADLDGDHRRRVWLTPG